MGKDKYAVGEGYSLVDAHMALLRAFQAQKALLRPYGSSLGLACGQPRVISYLAVHERATQREMASFFGMDPAAVSRMLDALEKGGFVTVEANPGDRRTKRLRLTDSGRALVMPWEERCAEIDETMLDGFTDEERESFIGYLERARKNMVARRAEEAGVRE